MALISTTTHVRALTGNIGADSVRIRTLWVGADRKLLLRLRNTDASFSGKSNPDHAKTP
jgi:hypothetical protein